MDFEHQLKTLIFFHLEEHTSGSHVLQVLKEDDFASEFIASPDGIEKSSFSEANNTRGLEQFLQVFRKLYAQAHKSLPKEYAELVAIDGSLIDAVLSMHWAAQRRQKPILDSMSMSPFQKKSSLQMERGRSGPLSIRYLNPLRPASWTGAINAIRLLICYRTKRSILYVASAL